LKVQLLVIICFALSQSIFSLKTSDIEQIAALVKKHKIEKLLNKEEKYHAYSVLGKELELYGFPKEAVKYYKKSIDVMPVTEDPLEVYTGLLSVMYRDNPNRAATFFKSTYKLKVVNSKSNMRDDIITFWENIFSKGQKTENYEGFYGQYLKDRDLKKLLDEKKYHEAFELMNPKPLDKADINSKIQYDVVARLNGKRHGFFCDEMFNRFKNSPAITVEICRYLKTGHLKLGTLKDLKSRTEKNLPNLTYLVKTLEDIK